MIQAMIKIRLPVNRIKEALTILRPLVESTMTALGCVECELYRDALDEPSVERGLSEVHFGGRLTIDLRFIAGAYATSRVSRL